MVDERGLESTDPFFQLIMKIYFFFFKEKHLMLFTTNEEFSYLKELKMSFNS